MKDYGRFQTNHAKLIQCLEIALATADNLGTTLILGPAGSGRRLLAETILDKVPELPVKRWNSNINDAEIFDGDVVLVEEITQLSNEEQNKLVHILRSKVAICKWILTVNENEISFLDENLLKLTQTFQLRVPSLQERSEDIPFLIQHLVSVFALIQGKTCPKISAQSLQILRSYRWPGNIAELERVLEKAMQHCGSEIMPHHLFFDNTQKMQPRPTTSMVTLADMEKRLILQTLEITQNNKTKAAELLGISIRTLRNKLNIYRVEGVQI